MKISITIVSDIDFINDADWKISKELAVIKDTILSLKKSAEYGVIDESKNKSS